MVASGEHLGQRAGPVSSVSARLCSRKVSAGRPRAPPPAAGAAQRVRQSTLAWENMKEALLSCASACFVQ